MPENPDDSASQGERRPSGVRRLWRFSAVGVGAVSLAATVSAVPEAAGPVAIGIAAADVLLQVVRRPPRD
jgi:hypothetical protein